MVKVAAAARAVAGKDVRQQILDASLELLKTQGLQGLSMREVARRAGVSHQAPYHHFPEREAILAELARDGFETLLGYMRGAGGATQVERMTSMGVAYIRFATEHPEQFRLMFRHEMCDLARYPNAKAAAEATFALLVETMTDGGAETPADTANIMASWSMAHGLATLLLDGKGIKHLGEPGPAQDQLIRSVLGVLARGAEKTGAYKKA